MTNEFHANVDSFDQSRGQTTLIFVARARRHFAAFTFMWKYTKIMYVSALKWRATRQLDSMTTNCLLCIAYGRLSTSICSCAALGEDGQWIVCACATDQCIELSDWLACEWRMQDTDTNVKGIHTCAFICKFWGKWVASCK